MNEGGLMPPLYTQRGPLKFAEGGEMNQMGLLSRQMIHDKWSKSKHALYLGH